MMDNEKFQLTLFYLPTEELKYMLQNVIFSDKARECILEEIRRRNTQ